MEKCPHAVRTNDVSLHCGISKVPNDFCAFQYLCRQTRRFENSQGWYGCLLLKKHREEQEKERASK